MHLKPATSKIGEGNEPVLAAWNSEQKKTCPNGLGATRASFVPPIRKIDGAGQLAQLATVLS